MTHREAIKEYLGSIHLKNCAVLDVGSGTKPVKRYIHHNSVKFFTIDILDHVGADLVTDIEQPLRLQEWYDHAFCMEVLEHVWHPQVVLHNIRKSLKKDGLLHLSVPYLFRTHSDKDYLRYTHIGLRRLVEECGFDVQMLCTTVGELETAEGFLLRARKISRSE